nr:MAG TPA: hypothetical protein [Caudoviricetes sp.]
MEFLERKLKKLLLLVNIKSHLSGGLGTIL